jgi:DNA primase
MNYETLFWKKQHYITIKNRNNGKADRRLLFNNKQAHKIIKNQKENTDVFISKYPLDNILNCIILDFDSEENIKLAHKEAKKVQRITRLEGLNTLIVQSGKKGYHTYTQIPLCKSFLDSDYLNIYIKELIKFHETNYHTFDERNFTAGLNGNIRLIGSKHPSTNNKCEIIDGEFVKHKVFDEIIEFQIPNQYHIDCLELANQIYKDKIKAKERKHKENLKKQKKRLEKGFDDPIHENDLRDLMPQIFHGESKSYDKGYLYMQCPFHPDEHPSLLVTKEYYSCSACGEKGNIWTLKKKDHIDWDYDGKITSHA